MPYLTLTGDKTSPIDKEYTLKIAAANNSDCIGYHAKFNFTGYGFAYVRSETLNCTRTPGVEGAICDLGTLAAHTGTFGSFVFKPTTTYCNTDATFSAMLFMDWPGMLEDEPHHSYQNFRVTMTCPGSSASSSRSSSSFPTFPDGTIDISVTQTSQTIVSCRNTLQNEFTVTNIGTAAAISVALYNPLPAGTTYVTSDFRDCVLDGTIVKCSLNSMQPGESKKILLMLNVNAGYRGYITNTATVTADYDFNQSNNVTSYKSTAYCYDAN